jgi:hypothetical protein
MKPELILRNAKPLFIDDTGKLVVGKGNSLFRHTDEDKLNLLVRIPESAKKRLMSFSGLISRLARLGFGAGVCYKGVYFFSYNSKIFSFCLKQQLLTHEFSFSIGRGPLTFTAIEDIQGFRDGIYFGEYFGNRGRSPVSVYARGEGVSWTKVYTFQSNQINHIHSLIPDPRRQCVWILAGDFEHSASIWMAKNGFKEVTQIVAGRQIYRACVAFPISQGLLYATDTQMEANSLRILSQSGENWISNHLQDINGSCIYGCELADYFIFSTATEPSDQSSSSIFSLVDYRPGPGIVKNRSDVIAVKKNSLDTQILFSKRKDFLPYRLFQFGAILFPHGCSQENVLYSYSIGNWKNDLSTEVYNLDMKSSS